MTDFVMCDRSLDELAKDYAKEIASEIATYGGGHGDEWELAYQYADGSEWVIYTYKAHQLCQNCNTDAGEDFAQHCGEPEGGWTYDRFAYAIAYGEIASRIMLALDELKSEAAE